jgi:hypothetical protein
VGPKLNVNLRECLKAASDAAIFGTGALFITERKWWNPMRYIKGPVKQKRLDPNKLFLQKGG